MLSANARAYYRNCKWALMDQDFDMALLNAPRIKVELIFYPPDRRRRDLDNGCKACLDALSKCDVITDDSQIKEIHMTMREPAKPSYVIVRLSHMEEDSVGIPDCGSWLELSKFFA